MTETAEHPKLKADAVKSNAFSENLGTDFIAVDANGTPVARASDRETVERAAPGHSGVFTGKDFPKSGPKGEPVPEPTIPAGQRDAVDAAGNPINPALNTDPTSVATARPATDHTFEDAVEGAEQSTDEGQKKSAEKTANDVKDNADKQKSDDKPNKDAMDHDKDGTRGGTASRQRKPAEHE